VSATPPPEDSRSESPSSHDIGTMPIGFTLIIIFTFSWIVLGLSLIFGYRIYWDAPIDPSFVPFMCVGFGVIVAFAIVISLSYVAGELEFELPGFKAKGASGPIILWVICFLAILFGFYIMGVSEILKSGSHQQLPLPYVKDPSEWARKRPADPVPAAASAPAARVP
jgi:hypothetical protein